MRIYVFAPINFVRRIIVVVVISLYVSFKYSDLALLRISNVVFKTYCVRIRKDAHFSYLRINETSYDWQILKFLFYESIEQN